MPDKTKCPVFRLRHFVLTVDGLTSFLNLFSGNYQPKTVWGSNATEEGPSTPAKCLAEADVHQTHRTRPKVDFRMMPLSRSAGNEEKGDMNVNYGRQPRTGWPWPVGLLFGVNRITRLKGTSQQSSRKRSAKEIAEDLSVWKQSWLNSIAPQPAIVQMAAQLQRVSKASSSGVPSNWIR